MVSIVLSQQMLSFELNLNIKLECLSNNLFAVMLNLKQYLNQALHNHIVSSLMTTFDLASMQYFPKHLYDPLDFLLEYA
jgi:hypothetical protein